jgi:hypothetical protein
VAVIAKHPTGHVTYLRRVPASGGVLVFHCSILSRTRASAIPGRFTVLNFGF